ncbi:MAG: biotin-dependent carboxyltransferase family protein [Ruminococcaceae bacterium]|nr:biotin-dependent carboxyltransferase family protein [Oscillospiraceae bacterium]
MSITVVSPGLLTSVQDAGRFGYQQFGVSVSGVMDPRAMRIANILVGNDENEAVLECTMLGPELRFSAANVVAITGGDLGPTLDNQPIAGYAAIVVQAGQTLRFTVLRSGCRAYIAFAGGLDIPQVMGSRSTDMKAKIGGLNGRKLEKNDEIGFRASNPDVLNLVQRRIAPEVAARESHTVRVLMGPQEDMFTPAGIKTFLNETYAVTNESDRMGCRMEGPVIEHRNSGDIISDGIAFGAIQVPTAGKPIIMFADRQTTGGYAKIANVITADFRIIGQLKAGDRVRFVKTTIEEAQDALLTERAALRALKTMTGPAKRKERKPLKPLPTKEGG